MKFTRLLTLVAVLFLGLSTAFAQTSTTGAVNGVITDQTGAAIPGATVTITSSSTGAVTTTKANGSGAYRFDLLEPGKYEILVDQAGFSKFKSTIQVDASKVLDGNLKLTIGSDAVTISVEAAGQLIEAENGNVSHTVSQVVVEQVPNSGNNLIFETKITPGFNNGGSAFGVVGFTSYQIDGENFNDPYNNSNNSGASNLLLGLNDVQEATITGNGYSGQFGGLVGATVSFLSKQGGNRIHGNMNYFWTGRSLVANTFAHKEFATTTGIVPRSFENANQWSAMISGPVTIPHLFNGKDKLFFLADAEGLRAILPASPTTVLLPSANLQAYTLSKLASLGLNNSIPFYKQLFALYNTAAGQHTLQNGNPGASSTAQKSTGCPSTLSTVDAAGLGAAAGACTTSYQSNAVTVANEALEIFRVDYNISAKDKFFVRYSHDDGFQPTGTDPINPIFNTVSIQPQHNGQFNETHTFGAKATNNFILAGLWYGALFGPSNLAANLAAFPAQLGVSDSSFTTMNNGITSFPTGRNITTVQIQDDFALSEGAHTLKVGAKAYYIKENDHYFTAGTVPGITAATMGAFINGGTDPASGANTTFAQTFPLKPNHPVGIDQWAVYFEDDWKATRSFSMTAALRLEHQGNIKCLDNCLTELSQPFPALAHSAPSTTLLATPYNQAYSFNQRSVLPGLQELEWEPRIGFAFNPPILHESMVIRGGYGIFFDGLAASVIEGVAKNPPQKDSFSVASDNLAPNETTNLWTDTAAYNKAFLAGIATGTYASIKASAPTSVQANFTPPSVYAAQNNFKMYSVQKWNLEIQKQFGKATVVSINYLGNHGEHKPYTNAGLNSVISPTAKGFVSGLPAATAPVSGVTTGYTPIDPRFGLVYYFVSGGSNNYNGVITTVTRKLGGSGGVVTAGYTYGKILDNGAGAFSTSTATGTTDIGAPPDPYNPSRFYGPAATDIRHNFVVSYVYKVPFKNIFYGGWEVSGAAYAYSGLPYTAIDTAGSTAISGYTAGAYGASLMANYQGGKQGKCDYGLDVCLTQNQFNSAANPKTNTIIYSAANPFSLDQNQGRNIWRGPKYVSTDFQLTKSIPLHLEGGHFEASVQAFNVLNHLNFAKPTGSLSSGSFGTVTATVNPSGIFSGVGGDDSPRIVQLKASIVF